MPNSQFFKLFGYSAKSACRFFVAFATLLSTMITPSALPTFSKTPILLTSGEPPEEIDVNEYSAEVTVFEATFLAKIPVWVDPEDTVVTVKRLVYTMMGMHPNEQMFVREGKRMNNEESVSSLKKGTRIDVLSWVPSTIWKPYQNGSGTELAVAVFFLEKPKVKTCLFDYGWKAARLKREIQTLTRINVENQLLLRREVLPKEHGAQLDRFCREITFSSFVGQMPHITSVDQSARSWCKIRPGFSLKGKCLNTACEAYDQSMWIPKGFGIFHVSELIKTAHCPKCDQLAAAVNNLAVYRCYFFIWGVSRAGAPSCAQECTGAAPESGFLSFKDDEESILHWSWLMLKTKKVES